MNNGDGFDGYYANKRLFKGLIYNIGRFKRLIRS